MTKKPHLKPVGTTVALQYTIDTNGESRTKHRGLTPAPKDIIELEIAKSFERYISDINGNIPAKLTQLDENDIDFEFIENDRRSKLEFTELVLTTPPYREDGDSAKIRYADFADKFTELVEKKNNKSYAERIPVDLLVYTTHFAYSGNVSCVKLAKERLRHLEAGSNFDRIYYLSFRQGTDHFTGGLAHLYQLKPYAPRLSAKERVELEGQFYITINNDRGTKIRGGTRFEMKL